MRVLYILTVAILALSGCVTYGGGSPYTETAAVCDISGLETQYTYIKDQSRNWRGALGIGLPKGGGAIGAERERADVEKETRSLARRINDYDAEVDAQYRTVTSSCKAYARCMEMNGYDEGDCRSSLSRWETAERAFTNLSRDLREIDAQVENLRTVTPGPLLPPPPRVNKCENGRPCY